MLSSTFLLHLYYSVLYFFLPLQFGSQDAVDVSTVSKSFDAVVFDPLKVSPEDFAVSSSYSIQPNFSS